MIDDTSPPQSQTGSAHRGETPTRPNVTQIIGDVTQVGEVATQVSEIDRLESEIESLDAALERIQSGTYGTCNVCGVAIDDALLKADPSLATCPAHVRLS